MLNEIALHTATLARVADERETLDALVSYHARVNDPQKRSHALDSIIACADRVYQRSLIVGIDVKELYGASVKLQREQRRERAVLHKMRKERALEAAQES